MIKPFKTASQPWLVKCNNDDNEKYIIKFSNEDNSFANEFVCYKIANAIGLTTTPSFPITIGADEIDMINRRKKEENEKPIIEGKYFASKFVNEPYTLNLERHNTLQPNEFRNLEQVPGMIVFDIFVDNCDRKNENALMHPIDNQNAIFEYVLIDHGHCFSGPSWTADSIRSNISYNAKVIPWKTTEIRSIGAFVPYTVSLDLLDRTFFKQVLDEIPPEWKHVPEDFTALLEFLDARDVRQILKKISEEARNNTKLFPNMIQR